MRAAGFSEVVQLLSVHFVMPPAIHKASWQPGAYSRSLAEQTNAGWKSDAGGGNLQSRVESRL